MPHIKIPQKNRAFEGSPQQTLMQALLDSGLPVASSCSGDGVCCKCRVQIVEGLEKLPSPNETEQFLIQKFKLKSNERVSCQVLLSEGQDISVQTTYW